MLTIDALRSFGANVDEGLARCLDNEAFYLRLVGLAVEDTCFKVLADAIQSGDKTTAFDAAHALKGSLGNLSLTPLYTPMAQLTELLRNGQEADCSALLTEIQNQRDALLALKN